MELVGVVLIGVASSGEVSEGFVNSGIHLPSTGVRKVFTAIWGLVEKDPSSGVMGEQVSGVGGVLFGGVLLTAVVLPRPTGPEAPVMRSPFESSGLLEREAYPLVPQ